MSIISTASCSPTARRRGDVLERIEVDADEVERLDLLLVERGAVVGAVAAGEDRGVDARVQRLRRGPPSSSGTSVSVLDGVTASPTFCRKRGRAAARDELDVELGEPARERLEALPCRRPRAGRARITRSARGRPGAAAGARRPGRARCSVVGVVVRQHGHALGGDHGAGVDAAVDVVDGAPRSRARRPRARPRSGARRGSPAAARSACSRSGRESARGSRRRSRCM